MSNVLGDDKRHQIVALGRLGWPLRGVRRETIFLRTPGKVSKRPRKAF